MSMTTNKTAPGEFAVLWNGEPTRYTIINGSHGFSGRGAGNTYGIVTRGSEKPMWIGSLHASKKLVALWLAKSAAAKAKERAA